MLIGARAGAAPNRQHLATHAQFAGTLGSARGVVLSLDIVETRNRL
jgi:hypothetical protein